MLRLKKYIIIEASPQNKSFKIGAGKLPIQGAYSSDADPITAFCKALLSFYLPLSLESFQYDFKSFDRPLSVVIWRT
jgi:hypothetical protein